MYVYLASFTLKIRTSFQKDVISQPVGRERPLYIIHATRNVHLQLYQHGITLHYITYFLNMFSIYVVK